MQSGRERLAAYRDRSQLNQKTLAQLLRITDSYLSQLLSGRRKPGRDIAVRIEQETGVPVGSWSDTSVSVVGRKRTAHTRKPRSYKELTGGLAG